MDTIHTIFKLLLGYFSLFWLSRFGMPQELTRRRNLAPSLQDAILMKIAETHDEAAPASS